MSESSPDRQKENQHPPEKAAFLPVTSRRIGLSVALLALIGGAAAYTFYASGKANRAHMDVVLASEGVVPAGNFQPPNVFQVDDDKFCNIPKDEIFAGGPPKDGIPALTDPKTIGADEASELLRPEDKVIGISFHGASRAYPLRILNWHEIANDTVGGLHVAVTYCPLCHSALVFDRDIGGEVREFGVSGLLYNSNVLMYDRQESEAEESLWSQMLFTAACGPAAEEGLELRLLPSEFTTWRAWHEAHPETDVLSFETGYPRNYDRNPYEQYFAVDELMFPVKSVGEAAPDFDSVPPKENTIVLQSGSALKGYAVSRLMEAVGEDGVVEDEFGGTVYRFELVDERGPSFRVTTDDGELAPAAYTFWFEFRAMHPTAEVFAAI